MPKISDVLRKSILDGVGYIDRKPPLNELYKSERSLLFEKYRMNRKVMGVFRYGLMGEEGKPEYNRVDDIIRRLELYKRDKNAEYLVDAANLAELEFVEGDCVLTAVDDGQHTDEI